MKKGIVLQGYGLPVSVKSVGLTPVLGRCFKVTDKFCSADISVPLATKREWWSSGKGSAFLMYILTGIVTFKSNLSVNIR
jgi:hypothetical protein